MSNCFYCGKVVKLSDRHKMGYTEDPITGIKKMMIYHVGCASANKEGKECTQ